MNNELLTANSGQLFINNNPIDSGSNNGVIYTTSGNMFHTFFNSDVSISGGNLAFFADTTGNLITDADIYLITSTPETASGVLGGSSGSMFGAPSMPNMIYIGDDSIQLGALFDPNLGNIISVNTNYEGFNNNSTGISIVADGNQYIFITSGNISLTTTGNLACSEFTLPIPPYQGFNSNQNVFGYINLGCESFTQSNSITTSIAGGNLPVGKIFTQNCTLGSQTITQFQVGHNFVGPNSIVIANIINYSGTYGTQGLPSITVNNLLGGAFSIVIMNNSTTHPLSGNLTIGYQIHSPENET